MWFCQNPRLKEWASSIKNRPRHSARFEPASPSPHVVWKDPSYRAPIPSNPEHHPGTKNHPKKNVAEKSWAGAGSRPFRSAASHNFPHYPEPCEQRGFKNYTVIQKILPRWHQTRSPRRMLQRLQKKPGRRAYLCSKIIYFWNYFVGIWAGVGP